jgi:hypothetical protein
MPSYYKMHLDETLKAGIYGGQVPTLDFLTKVSTTIDPLFKPGDTLVLPDGREFRYALSTGAGAIKPQYGCNFTDTGFMAYTLITTTKAAGVVEMTIPAATHAVLTKDQLAGGYLIIFDNTYDADVTYGITGNDVSLADVAFNIKLDMPLALPLTAVDAVEVYSNPWKAIALANTTILPRCGSSVSYVSAAANYFWVQTRGIKHISPQAGIGADNGGMDVYWRHDGTIQKGETALAITVNGTDTNQCAGYVISGSAAGNGPLVNLTGY